MLGGAACKEREPPTHSPTLPLLYSPPPSRQSSAKGGESKVTFATATTARNANPGMQTRIGAQIWGRGSVPPKDLLPFPGIWVNARGEPGLTWVASFLGAAPAGTFGHGEAGVPGLFSWQGKSHKRVAVLHSTKCQECRNRGHQGGFPAATNQVIFAT